jgi:hypothetical protein
MLYLKKMIILILLAVSVINNTFSASLDNSFLGRWCWDLSSEVSVFSLTIKKDSGLYVGRYSSVIEGGYRIDDNDDAFTFKATKNNIIRTKIKTGISGKTGLIQLKLLNNEKIEWIVLQKPKGEFLVPLNATLHKCK